MVHFGEAMHRDARGELEWRPPAVILCGGRGERLGELTLERAKAMVEIGRKPILWHIMRHFQRHGVKDYALALGYLGWVIEYYFREADGFDGRVSCIPTGWDTQNGGRLKRLDSYLRGTFFMAWCDGVSDLDLTSMLAYHRRHGKLCTVATVQPPERFGSLSINEADRVVDFREKGRSIQWINAGFFCCEPGVLDYISGDHTQWEREPME